MTPADDLFSAIRATDLATVDLLLTDRPDLAASKDSNGLSALTVAAYYGQRSILDRILAAEPDLDRFEASIVGDVNRLAKLLDEPNTEPIDQRSADGFTALHLAAFFGRLGAAQELLDRGADANSWATGSIHVQALHSACAAGHEEIARLLIEHGAEPNGREDGGSTPLHSAAGQGMTSLSDFLMEHGADPKDLTDDMLTPADIAGRAGYPELAAHLRTRASN
jgi:uncharacterized protein